MKSKHLAIPLLASLVLSGCIKQQTDRGSTCSDQQVQKAKAWFQQNVLNHLPASNTNNYRASLSKTILWDHATIMNLAGSQAVIAPLQFTADVYLRSASSGPNIFRLSDASRLVIYRDSANNMKYQQLTFIPDSDYESSDAGFSGVVLTEDWSGNTLVKPSWIKKHPANKTVDIVQQMEVCNEIDGYNYSPDDASAGSSWSETSCNTYEFDNPASGGSTGPPNLGAYLISRPLPLTITLSTPTSPIANIADYFKCFTPGDASHNFTVTLAVEQPDQGTRQPWTLTSGGVPGSSQAGNAVNVGHSFLIFSEGSGGQLNTQRSVGFYPQGIVSPFSTNAQGILGNDQYADYNICLTISVSSTQFFTMLQYVAQGNNSGYMYNLNSNNCTTFALDALDAGGVSIPSTIGFWVGSGQGLDPGDLGEDIRNMQLPGNMTRNTVSNSHPNVGTCN